MKTILSLAIIAGIMNVAHAAVEQETAASVNTESISVEEVAPAAPASKKWSVKLESENVKTMTSQNTSYDGDIQAYQYLHAGYKLADNLSTAVVSTWTQRYGYKENSSQTTFEDLHVRLTRSNLFNTGSMSWTTQGRVYLPTSRSSNEANQYAQVRGYLIGSQSLSNKLGLELVISPRYYIYENDNRTTGKNDWRILNSAGLKYSVNDALAVETTLGVYSKKKVNAADMNHFQDYSTSVYYTVSNNVELNAGIRAVDGALDTATDGVQLYNHNLSEYYLIGTVSL